ncbi:hypothetical protein GCM10022631_29680 [Deinococcus rubellus]|uniref:Uncharacterized protein n=2 Tax=Deinococcus rubellus TaxID=1889240 RepID=A0ABY5YHL6_9DEIO|nr:hypothetical protein [Deinococcus rubellus]UWX64186.1 hypothetical protein N0D28_00455 [Deinococcus rubellus]
MQNLPAAQPQAESERKPREQEEICGAKGRRNGKPCRHPAGFRTDHSGSGRCWLHGGLTPAPKGRYTSIRRARIKELLIEFQDDPDPLNLLPEAMLLRALVQDFIDRFDEQDQMLTRWNLSFEKAFQSDWSAWWNELRADALECEGDLSEELLVAMPDPMTYLPSKPLRMSDITKVSSLIDKIGTMVERIRKARSVETFSMNTIDLLWTAMSAHLTQAMLEVIEDDPLRSQLHASVEEKWSTISLAELASRSTQNGAGEG